MLCGPPLVITVTPLINLPRLTPEDLDVVTGACITLPTDATVHWNTLDGMFPKNHPRVCFGKVFIYVVCARQVSKLSLTGGILAVPGGVERQSCQ